MVSSRVASIEGNQPMEASSLLSACTFIVASCHLAGSAVVEGRVILRGTPPPEIVIKMSGDCAAAQTKPPTTRHYVVSQDGGLANVFVVIRSGLEGKKFSSPANEVRSGRTDPVQFELAVPVGP